MLMPSCSRFPVAPVRLARSLPARSTKWNLALRNSCSGFSTAAPPPSAAAAVAAAAAAASPAASSLRQCSSSCEGVAHEGSPTKAHTRRHTLLIEEPQSLQAMPLERLRRAPDWAVAVNNIAFMAVPRSIPANFVATGWVIGSLALVSSSIVTYDTGLLIGQLCESSGASSFPELAAEAMGRFSARHGWPEGRRARGRRLAHGLTLSMQFATYYLAEVCELIYFEQYFGQIFGASPLCQWQWLLVGALIALPVTQVHLQPDASRLQPEYLQGSHHGRLPPRAPGARLP